MSVTDLDKVDAMGLSQDGKVMRMLIADHLDWEDEEVHLSILQDKINAYIAYIEGGDWKHRYSMKLDGAEIQIDFLYDIPETCEKFLQVVQDQVGQYCIRIKAVVVDDSFREKIKKDESPDPTPPKKPGFRFPFFGKR